MVCKNSLHKLIQISKSHGGGSVFKIHKGLNKKIKPLTSVHELADKVLELSFFDSPVYLSLLHELTRFDAEAMEEYRRVVGELFSIVERTDETVPIQSLAALGALEKIAFSLSIEDQIKIEKLGKQLDQLCRDNLVKNSECHCLSDKFRSDNLTVVECSRCNWTNQYSSPIDSGRNLVLSACPNCNPKIKTQHEKALIGKIYSDSTEYLLGDFSFFNADDKRVFTEMKIRETRWIRNKPPKDMQKRRVYRAEDTFSVEGRQFSNQDEIQNYINSLLETEWFKKHFPHGKPIRVKLNDSPQKSQSISKGDNWLSISPNMMNELTILHELAHQVIQNQPPYISFFEQPHGDLFAYTFLKLVDKRMGADARRRLEDAFDNHNVRWRSAEKKYDEMLALSAASES